MKKEIKMGLKNDLDSFKVVNTIKSKSGNYYQGVSSTSVEVEKMVKPGYLINRNNHPVTLSYDGEALILSPREKVVIANVDKLGGLCSGVVFIPNNSLKN